MNRPGFRAASFLVRKDAIMPKHYDAEVKAQAVRLVAEHKVESGSVTKSCEAVGRRLGISKETLRGWCRQAQVDAGEREGVTSEELAEIKRLKAENRRLREDVEFSAPRQLSSRGSSTPETVDHGIHRHLAR
jgi:transposase